MYFHKAVMPDEVLKYIAVASDKVYVDCTLGEGGHSELILKHAKIKLLVAIEQDKEILKIAKERLKKYKNIIFINDNFFNLTKILKEMNLVRKVDGILMDLGLSMYHYKESKKGFSFERDEYLDMSFTDDGITAYEIVNYYSEQEISRIIWVLGEERWARRIARNIVEYRKNKKIETTFELKKIVEKSIPRKFWKRNQSPATKTFQALRIAVNNELVNLEKVLPDVIKLLNKKGRAVVLSYHSLEDRIVKNIFRLYDRGYDEEGLEHPDKKGIIKILTKKPITAGEEEIRRNRSSRSAKLRAVEKL